MDSITKITTIAIPTAISIGIAWVGTSILRNERRLEMRKMELEVQLGAKSLKSF
tara:strand:- start:202 stop:363 length:162 start_codon:yes stop_codon:yes gene_type:complete